MKNRVISGAIIGAITIAVVLLGGIVFKAMVAFIMIWGSYEFLSSRGHKINWLEFAIMLTYIFLVNIFNQYALPLTLIMLTSFITLSIFNEAVNFDECSVSIVESILLAFGTYQLLEIRSINLWLLGYIIIISYLTDVGAYFVGMKFGKHKLNKRVSPKKTIEGAIGGIIIGAIISFVWSCFFNFFGFGVTDVIICSLVLPIISEIGDLAFSLIKRHFNTKDFSNLIPGHGGLLDRLDSLLFTLIIYGAIVTILL